MTTHPDYIEAMAKWSSEYPDSVYAKTAKGRHMYHLAWLIRGETTANEIYYKAAEQMRDYFRISASLAYEVILTRSNFPPASDLALLSSQHAYMPMKKSVLTGNALTVNPDVHTLDLVLRLYSPQWGGGLRKQKALCKKYERILIKQKGYTADMCFAEEIITNSMRNQVGSLTEEIVLFAYDILEKAPKDKMRAARFIDAVSIRPDIDGALELAAELLPSRNGTFRILAAKIETELSREGFADKYAKTKEIETRDQLKRDPYNPNLLEKVIKYTYSEYDRTKSPETYKLYEKYIDDTMIYGRYRPDT